MQNNTNYTAESVQTLEGLEPFRKSPGMYIGSTGSYGLHHIVKELLNNAIDEALNGTCTDIYTTLLKDGGIKIEDNGRGFPHGMLDDTFSILGGCFGKEHTGGKFNNSGDSGYNTSGGMHGIGCKCAAALGKLTKAISHRDGIEEIVEFSQGKMLTQITDNVCDKNLHGSVVYWYPDETIFTETVTFDKDKIEKELCQEYSFLNSGLKFHIKDEKTGYEHTYVSQNGLKDYLDFLNKNESYVLNPICISAAEGSFSIEVGIAYNVTYSNIIKLYTNSIPQSKGSHLTGFRTAWTAAINKFARANKFLKDSDENITGEDLSEGQLLVINFKMIDPVFEGQVKDNLTSSEGRTYTQKLITSSIDSYLNANKNGIKAIIDKALGARKAREAARKARDAARECKKEKKMKLLNLPTKLVDANSRDRKNCELYICEGDSAAGGLIEVRDSEYVGIFPIRGKMINLYKNSAEKVLANEEVNNLKKALGLDIDAKTGKLIYDVNKLRYGKILTACDADPDGQAIKNLILTCLWTICPELILNGHVYVTIPPLYRITRGKDNYIYLRDNTELEQYKLEHNGEKFVINRNKGLGEQDASELEPCLLNPKTRNIAQITVPDRQSAEELFETLMGTSVPPRRTWLLNHSEEAGDNLW